ncbi:hypothetical protein ABZY09_09870 [Streptomyces sp. NPDC002928]|uniref:hypothetical protein n=1 Tax=Streptomyces sp. NPDC002928 TaxID=3154440 RepID=UPI0033B1806D
MGGGLRGVVEGLAGIRVRLVAGVGGGVRVVGGAVGPVAGLASGGRGGLREGLCAARGLGGLVGGGVRLSGGGLSALRLGDGAPPPAPSAT